jgi:hypothetical protein
MMTVTTPTLVVGYLVFDKCCINFCGYGHQGYDRLIMAMNWEGGREEANNPIARRN